MGTFLYMGTLKFTFTAFRFSASGYKQLAFDVRLAAVLSSSSSVSSFPLTVQLIDLDEALVFSQTSVNIVKDTWMHVCAFVCHFL